MSGVRIWLDRFAGESYHQAIGSSAPQANIDALVDELGIRNYFKAIVSGANMPGKPDPAVFLEAARLIEIPAEKNLVIEDSVAGVAAARRAEDEMRGSPDQPFSGGPEKRAPRGGRSG